MAYLYNHSHKNLIIPDYVLLSDLTTIANFFEKYNIAKIKSVNFYEGNTTMYEDDNGDTHYYGYAKIEIDEYYNNQCSKNFYDTIINNKCKIVFDDYDYWDLKFDFSFSSEVNVDNIKKELEIEVNNNSDIENTAHEVKEEVEEEVKGEVEDEVEEEVEEELYDDKYSFEYYNKLDSIQTRSKTNSKTKSKTNPGNDKSLNDLIIKKNKNYLKNNKRKEFKNEWTRRLRCKLAA